MSYVSERMSLIHCGLQKGEILFNDRIISHKRYDLKIRITFNLLNIIGQRKMFMACQNYLKLFNLFHCS